MARSRLPAQLAAAGRSESEDREGFPKLLEMVSEIKASKTIVACGDRLTGFGSATLRKLSQSFGAEIEVINYGVETPQEGLAKDYITVVSRFAGSLYGLSSHRYRVVVEGVEKYYVKL